MVTEFRYRFSSNPEGKAHILYSVGISDPGQARGRDTGRLAGVSAREDVRVTPCLSLRKPVGQPPLL